MSILSAAVKSGNIGNVKELLKMPSINPTFCGERRSWESNPKRSPIFVAIYNGKTSIVHEMLKNDKVAKEFEYTIKVRIIVFFMYHY